MSEPTSTTRRTFTLMYHDVVPESDFRSSGLSQPGSDRYKLGVIAFDAHLEAIRSRLDAPPVSIETLPSGGRHFLTFDDGGSSAASIIGPKLSALGWVGHFFITTDRIGTPGFVTAREILALHHAGHIIGSHSCSHPQRFSRCPESEQRREWSESVAVLTGILGQPVVTASVPGGYYAREVAHAAERAGIRYLFNSEPTTRPTLVGNCTVIGRFAVVDTTPPTVAAALIAGEALATARQAILWQVKGWAKRLGGRAYLKLRDHALGSREET